MPVLLPLLALLVMLDGPFPVVPSEPLLMTATAVASVAAGRFGLPNRRFTVWSLVSSTAWTAYMMGIGVLLGPLTGGGPVRGLLAGVAMAALTGGTFTLVRRICRRRSHDLHPPHAAALTGALGCDR